MVDLSLQLGSKSLKKVSGELRGVLVQLVVPLICILAALALVLVVIIPGVSAIKQLREEKDVKEQKLNSYEEKNRKLLGFKESGGIFNEALHVVNNALPDDEKVPELMTELQTIAGEVGMPVSSLQYSGSKGKPTGGSSEIHLQLGVDGDFEQVQTLLDKLENASRVVVVDQFNLSERKEASMAATLSVSSFFMPSVTRQQIDVPITLDLNSAKFKDGLEKIKALKVYEVQLGEGSPVGKENPFVK